MESSIRFYVDTNDTNDDFANVNTLKILLLGNGKSSSSIKNYYKDKGVLIDILRPENKKECHKFYKELPMYDICFRSPGIAINKSIYTVCKLLSKQFTNELAYALKISTNKNKIIVTGSNGKTSLCKLLYEVLSLYKTTHLYGNIGTPLIDKLEQINDDDFLLIEASSFQLENLDSLIDIGIIKNLMPNHLNSTHNLASYYASKKRLKLFSKKFIENDGNTIYLKNNYIYVLNQRYLNIDELLNQDSTYIENIIYATKILLHYNLDINKAKKIFKNYTNLKYRNEITKINNITFVNDGKSTSSGASKYCFSMYKGKRILILGGIHKSNAFKLNISKEDIIYAYGKDRERIKREIGNVKTYLTLKEVLENIDLEENITVIFSPGCSSFDQYDGYISRSKEFERWVNKWIK